jgi:hypothetical protein
MYCACTSYIIFMPMQSQVLVDYCQAADRTCRWEALVPTEPNASARARGLAHAAEARWGRAVAGVSTLQAVPELDGLCLEMDG